MKKLIVFSIALMVVGVWSTSAQQRVEVARITAAATGTQTAANSDSIVCASDTGCAVKIASGGVASGAIASGALASGSIASGALASGAVSSGAIASGAIASGAVASGAIASGAIASGAFAAGSLNSALPDPCLYSAKSYAVVSISSATTTTVISASASNKAYICDVFLIASAADNVAMVEDATAACASPDAGMSGGTTSGTGWNLTGNGFNAGNGLATVFKTASTNVNVCFITSSTAQLSGTVSYVLAP